MKKPLRQRLPRRQSNFFSGNQRQGLAALLLAALLFALPCPPATAADSFAKARQAMVKTIEQYVRADSSGIGKKVLAPRVMAAMAKVERHAFVPPELQPMAYENRPLPIGYGQTISQPYLVALMTDLLEVGPDDRVFELGTGSGYQAAVLAELAKEVYTMEIVPALGEEARARLKALHYDNVRVRVGDGYHGWQEHAPFDAIIVTASVSHIPPPLLRQLKPGGRLLVPLGSPFMVQQLVLVEKDTRDRLTIRQLMPVRFVPLTGGH